MQPLSSRPLDADVPVEAAVSDMLTDVSDDWAELADPAEPAVGASDVEAAADVVAAAVLVSVAAGVDEPHAPSKRAPAAQAATSTGLGVRGRNNRVRRIMRSTPRGESVRVRPLRRDRPECGRSP